jgi:hypothetical protein
MSRRECLMARSDPGHLLTCPVCRAEARVAGAWRQLAAGEAAVKNAAGEAAVRNAGEAAREGAAETFSAVDEAFVARVMHHVRRDRARTVRRRALLAAAAALLFSFFFGTGHESAKRAAPSAEETYGSLLTPSGLDDLIPN